MAKTNDLVEMVRNMTDEELFALSVQKDKKGCYTWASGIAYAERQRRSGFQCNIGNGDRCSKYRSDYDYYGSTDKY